MFQTKNSYSVISKNYKGEIYALRCAKLYISPEFYKWIIS